MSKVCGRLVTCDRCGESIFRKCTEEKELDGGFTRWNTFEPLPNGWGMHNGKDLCPECFAMWKTIENEFMNAERDFMKGDGGKCNT